MYLVTAWNETTEKHHRARDPEQALQYARKYVNQGMRVSIIHTATGQARAVNELQAEIDAKRT